MLSSTDAFDGKVLALSLRFKLNLKASFPKAKKTSALMSLLEMTPLVFFLNELSE